jgi:hypothetical protein
MARVFQAKGILVPPKDKILREQKSGVVYHIPGGDCSGAYVGETEHALKTRLMEHKRPSSVTSPVVEIQN